MVIQGILMKTFISAVQEKENSVSRVAPPGNFMERTGNPREPCLRTEWAFRSSSGSAQLTKVDIVSPRTELWLGNSGCEFNLLLLHFTFCVTSLSLFVALILVLNSIRHMQNIHHYPTSKFGDTLRESDTDLRNPGF